jgi:drug/metabolite transporter (DMT)-like permease
MMSRATDYLYVAATILFTVYGQIVLKWRIAPLGPLPAEPLDKLRFLLSLLLDPFILSGFAAAFFASLAWMAAMTRLELSHAYPFMALNFIIVLLLSGWLLAEPVTLQKGLGVALIVIGTVVAASG